MDRLKLKQHNQAQRKNRVRTLVKGTSARPRLAVYVSNRHLSAQIIDDEKHVTIVSSSTTSQSTKGNLSEKAALIGKDIAKKAKAKKIKEVSFDRGPKLYHGRVKVLADAAREEGLKF